tara:strand:+ start:394 stop:648 length:255 start_codon:yes stop_codon:yes gene_type:complete
MKTEHVKNEVTGEYDYKTTITSDQYYLIRKALRALDRETVDTILDYRQSLSTMDESSSMHETYTKSLGRCVEEHFQIKEMFKDL